MVERRFSTIKDDLVNIYVKVYYGGDAKLMKTQINMLRLNTHCKVE